MAGRWQHDSGTSHLKRQRINLRRADSRRGQGTLRTPSGLGAAVDYLERIGMANISRYEHDLLLYAIEQLSRIPGLRLIGTAKEKAGVLSFVLDEYRTEDVGAALNRQGIAVRAGHHCAQPILRRFGVESTVRPSLAFYNTLRRNRRTRGCSLEPETRTPFNLIRRSFQPRP